MTIHPLHTKTRNTTPTKFMKALDRLLLVVASVMPLATLPQIYEIYVNKVAAGVSLWTWLFLTVLALPWIVYGVVHKEKPIIVMYILWFVLQLTIVVGVVVYS